MRKSKSLFRKTFRAALENAELNPNVDPEQLPPVEPEAPASSTSEPAPSGSAAGGTEPVEGGEGGAAAPVEGSQPTEPTEPVEPGTGVPEVEVVEVPVDQVAEDILELNDAEGDIEAEEVQSDEIEEAQASLEQMYLQVKISQTNGGMSKGEANLLNMMRDNIQNRTGLQSRLPSNEGYQGTNNKMRATNVALEALKIDLKGIATAAVAALEALWEKIRNWMLKVWNVGDSLVKKGEALKAAAKGTITVPVKVKLSESKARDLVFEGKVASGADVIKAIDNAKNAADSAFTKSTDQVKKTIKGMAEVLSGADCTSDEKFDATVTVESLLAIPMPTADSVGATIEVTGDSRFGDGAVVKRSPGFLGGKALFYVEPAGYEGANKIPELVSKRFRGLTVATAVVEEKFFEEVKEQEVSPLTQTEIGEVAQGVIELGGKIGDYKRAWKERDDIMTDLKRAVKEYTGRVKAADKLSDTNKSAARALTDLGKAGSKMAGSTATAIMGDIVKTSKIALDFGYASMKADSKEAPAA